MTITYHQDPGHGWLEVPMALLREWGLSDGITEYSYRHGDVAYLEEDCDAGVFMRTAKARGVEVRLVESHTNGDSFIRRLGRFPVPAVPAWKAAMTGSAA